MEFYPTLNSDISNILEMSLSEDRKKILQPLIDYIQSKIEKKQTVQLNFICTHNSRRSQFAQIWTKTAAIYYGIEADCFSGGVEVTEFNANAVEAIASSGFQFSKTGDKNPHYSLRVADGSEEILCYSKLHSDKKSPRENFATIMVCSHADENCPLILGAEKRFPIRYEDPKAFDQSPEKRTKYKERSQEIASEMFYVFSQIKK